MTADTLLAVTALLASTAILVGVVGGLVRDTGLGIAHPAAVWTAFTITFFGIGGLALAFAGRSGPAAFTAGAMAAVAIGLGSSSWLARRRVAAGMMVAGASASGLRTGEGHADTLTGLRLPFVVGLAAVGLVVIAPTLLRTGLPFLVQDITGARVELAGLPIQVTRVTLPALSAIALLVALHRRTAGTVVLAGAVILVVGAFEVLLASRYLLAELAAVLVLTWLLSGRRMPTWILIAGALLAIAIFAGIQILRTWDQAAAEPIAFAITRTVDRVLLIGPRTLDALMTVIPAEQDHFGGLTWVRRVAPLVGRDDVPNLGYWIFPRVIPGGSGYAAPGWLGEAWANLGWIGLTLFLLLGMAMERVGALIESRRHAVVDIVAGACLILFIARTHALGVVGLGVVVVLVAIWRLAAGPVDGLLRDVAAIIRWRPIPRRGVTGP